MFLNVTAEAKDKEITQIAYIGAVFILKRNHQRKKTDSSREEALGCHF